MLKYLKSPWTRLALLGLGGFLLILALQIPWDRSYRTASGIPRSYAPYGDEIRRSDGSVDYRATLNRLMGPPPPAEKNAAITIGILAAPKELNSNAAWRKLFFKEVGADEAAAQSGRPFYDDFERAESFEQFAIARVWENDRDHPEMAKWLDKYPRELARLRETSQMQWYCPLVSPDPSEPMIYTLLPITQALRTAGRMLSAAAFREAGRGNIDQAVADVNAIYKLGLRARGATLIEELVAIAVARMGVEAAGELLRNSKLEEVQLGALADCFGESSPLFFFQSDKARGERYMVLDILQKVERDRLPAAIWGDITQADSGLKMLLGMGFGPFIDRGAVLQKLNVYYDSVGQWRQLFEFHGSGFEMVWLHLNPRLGIKYSEGGNWPIGRWVGIIFSPTERGKWFGEMFGQLGLPAIQSLARSEIRLSQQRGLLLLAIALEQHERRHGAYPNSLEQLVPEFLPVLPMNHFAETGSFDYQKLEQGFQLARGTIRFSSFGLNDTPKEFLLDRSKKQPAESEK